MNDMEVKVEQKSGSIGFNAEEIRESVKLQMEAYRDLPVTESNLAERKKDIATLRKIKKALDDKRKSVKTEFMRPYNAFEKEVKSILEVIEEPISLLDRQVKGHEENEKEKKRNAIREAYVEMVGDYAEFIDYEAIYKSAWENVSFSMKKVREEIRSHIDGAAIAIETIKSLESKYEDKGMEEYKRTKNLASAIERITRYQKQEEEILAKQEEERKASEEEQEVKREEPEEAPTFGCAAPIVENKEDEPFTSELTARYVVTASVETHETIEEFFNFNGIAYEREG